MERFVAMSQRGWVVSVFTAVGPVLVFTLVGLHDKHAGGACCLDYNSAFVARPRKPAIPSVELGCKRSARTVYVRTGCFGK
jgi:hypothetical protein